MNPPGQGAHISIPFYSIHYAPVLRFRLFTLVTVVVVGSFFSDFFLKNSQIFSLFPYTWLLCVLQRWLLLLLLVTAHTFRTRL